MRGFNCRATALVPLVLKQLDNDTAATQKILLDILEGFRPMFEQKYNEKMSLVCKRPYIETWTRICRSSNG